MSFFHELDNITVCFDTDICYAGVVRTPMAAFNNKYEGFDIITVAKYGVCPCSMV